VQLHRAFFGEAHLRTFGPPVAPKRGNRKPGNELDPLPGFACLRVIRKLSQAKRLIDLPTWAALRTRLNYGAVLLPRELDS